MARSPSITWPTTVPVTAVSNQCCTAIRRQPEQVGALLVDVDLVRRPHRGDAVEVVDHARHPCDERVGGARRLLQRRLVAAEQLDLDRIRIAAQVADHVLHDLHELDAQPGHRARESRRGRRP